MSEYAFRSLGYAAGSDEMNPKRVLCCDSEGYTVGEESACEG